MGLGVQALGLELGLGVRVWGWDMGSVNPGVPYS